MLRGLYLRSLPTSQPSAQEHCTRPMQVAPGFTTWSALKQNITIDSVQLYSCLFVCSPPQVQQIIFSSSESESSPQPEKITIEDLTEPLPGTVNPRSVSLCCVGVRLVLYSWDTVMGGGGVFCTFLICT